MHHHSLAQRAQAIILIPIMMLIIVGGALAAVNLATLSQKRMEVQIAADASARAGAFVQAECITGIANMNYLVVVLNPVIIVLEALAEIPFMEFLEVIADFLKMMITDIINPVQKVIWNPDSWYLSAAPYATFATVLGQGLENDSNTWSIMIPDMRLLKGHFLFLESKPIVEVTFGLYGNVYTRKEVASKDLDKAQDQDDSSIVEGVGVFTFRPNVELPFPNLYGILGPQTGHRDDSLFLYTISAAKPYFLRQDDVRFAALDSGESKKSLGLEIWSPINPWDARLCSWDLFLLDAVTKADGSGSRTTKFFGIIPISKLKDAYQKFKSGEASIKDIWNDLTG